MFQIEAGTTPHKKIVLAHGLQSILAKKSLRKKMNKDCMFWNADINRQWCNVCGLIECIPQPVRLHSRDCSWEKSPDSLALRQQKVIPVTRRVGRLVTGKDLRWFFFWVLTCVLGNRLMTQTSFCNYCSSLNFVFVQVKGACKQGAWEWFWEWKGRRFELSQLQSEVVSVLHTVGVYERSHCEMVVLVVVFCRSLQTNTNCQCWLLVFCLVGFLAVVSVKVNTASWRPAMSAVQKY